MGIYDYYSGVQLKVGPRNLSTFNIGDTVPIPDGAYLGFEGLAIIEGGVLVRTYDTIIDKWGKELEAGQVLRTIVTTGNGWRYE